MEYILASKSPRRKELMSLISKDFLVISEDIDEKVSYILSPIEAVKDISYRKGVEIAKNHPNSVVISADTIVVFNNEIIGKPKDSNDAKKILQKLSNNTHEVITGYSIFYKDKRVTNTVTTLVTFNKLNENLIKEYIATNSPLDKAGAYGIQDSELFPIIKNIVGSYNNVVGFPVEEIILDIKKLIVWFVFSFLRKK